MGQITSGIRAILASPIVYSAFQNAMGAHRGRMRFVRDFMRPYPGMKILDIGCGPADILNYLPKVEYYGFDISEAYIAQAQTRFAKRGRFFPQKLSANDLNGLPAFDIVLALGLLHHLDDAPATELLELASQALKPGGRLLTVDPCIDNMQSPVARFLVKNDRGLNVRTKIGYTELASSVFKSPHVEIRHQKWVPYTHCFMECTRNDPL